jgi:ABC-type transport system involved in cytochrome c biogenesis permease subunit
MYLQGRPPVTNLYSSAVFIGWGGVILGLFMEWIYKNGVGTAVGSALGALTLIIAHYLSTSGDTLEMMQAVLDTNFWLATHVTCITLGYMATFIAGALGIRYVITGVFTRGLHGEEMQNLTKMIYGVVCFATLLSFTGTVLGGIWADQSWGRFWGWDPKENGALLIVIWNALILHARWGGLVKSRGVALLAVGGNIVTAWSWFGVNMLGVGLHSYGFMSGAVFWLCAFVVSQLAIIGIGMMPLRMWASFAPNRLSPPVASNKPIHPLDLRAQDGAIHSKELVGKR